MEARGALTSSCGPLGVQEDMRTPSHEAGRGEAPGPTRLVHDRRTEPPPPPLHVNWRDDGAERIRSAVPGIEAIFTMAVHIYLL